MASNHNTISFAGTYKLASVLPTYNLHLTIDKNFKLSDKGVKQTLFAIESALRNEHKVLFNIDLDDSGMATTKLVLHFFSLLLNSELESEKLEIRLNYRSVDEAFKLFIRKMINDLFSLNIIFEEKILHNYAA